MLCIDAGSEIGDIAWLPNGSLLALLLDRRSGRSVSCRLVEWQLPNLSESVLAHFFSEHSLGQGWFNHELIRTDLSGELILLGSPFRCAYRRAGENRVVPERYFEFDELTVSPNGLRVFGTLLADETIQLLFGEEKTLFREIELSDARPREQPQRWVRTVAEDRQRAPFFFYAPDGKHVWKADADSLELGLYSVERADQDDLVIFDRLMIGHQLVEKAKLKRPLQKPNLVWISPDWKQVIFGSTELHFLDLEKGPSALVELVKGISHASQISDVGFHPNGRHLGFIREPSTSIEIYDRTANSICQTFNFQQGPISRIDFSRDGTMIAAVVGNNKIIVWDVDF